MITLNVLRDAYGAGVEQVSLLTRGGHELQGKMVISTFAYDNLIVLKGVDGRQICIDVNTIDAYTFYPNPLKST